MDWANLGAWLGRMGWRYVAAIASLLMFVMLAFRIIDEPLRVSLMAGFVSILALVLAVPIQRPTGEKEWFRVAGFLGTSIAVVCTAWLSVDEEIKLLVTGQGAYTATDWWIIGAYFCFGLIAAGGIVISAWLVFAPGRKSRL